MAKLVGQKHPQEIWDSILATEGRKGYKVSASYRLLIIVLTSGSDLVLPAESVRFDGKLLQVFNGKTAPYTEAAFNMDNIAGWYWRRTS